MSVNENSVEYYTHEKITELVKETPASGPKRSLGFIAAVATLGSLLFGYDTGVISGALPYMYMDSSAGGLGLTSTTEGLVGALLCLGAAVGASLGGKLSDMYGRRHNIMLLAIVFFVGALGCTFSPNVPVLLFFRFVLGFAVGGASATVPVFLGETAPKEIRGTLVAVDQMVIVFGQFLAFSMNAGLTAYHGGPDPTIGNGATWRYMLVLASLPAVFLYFGVRLLPESSRWYVANLRIAEAIGSLKRVRSEDYDIVGEVDEMIEVQRAEENQEKWGLSQIWNTKWTRHLLMIGIVLGLIDQFTGINTAMYYMPKVLVAAGFDAENSIIFTPITGFVSFVGSATGLWLVHRFARRHVAIYQETAIVISLGLMAFVFWKFIEPFMGADNSVDTSAAGWWAGAPILVVVIASLFVFAKQSGTVVWVIIAELYPAKARGVAIGVAVGTLWIANGIVAYIFPPMVASLGAAKTYLVFAIINVFSLLFYMLVVPETKYHSLEELELKFQKDYS